MKSYKALNRQVFKTSRYSIVPIRNEDKYALMKWRNEQMYHLRQEKLLTRIDQETYFEKIVAPLFSSEKPDQLLFSYLEDDICIGYGGLVHIEWIDGNAEISFIMNTDLENEYFSKHWRLFLSLIEQVAFKELKLNKIFTYAIDVRPKLYKPIENAGYTKEAVLKKHTLYDNRLVDVIIHAKHNNVNCHSSDGD